MPVAPVNKIRWGWNSRGMVSISLNGSGIENTLAWRLGPGTLLGGASRRLTGALASR